MEPDADFSDISGLSWKRTSAVIHNEARAIPAQVSSSIASYRLLGDPRKYLARTFLGQRTAAHQAALGCRFRCTFCGVAAMFRGRTTLPAAATLERDLSYLKHEVGADSIQFYDHNFFDREVDMEPLLDVMAKIALPWWCYARSDALLGLSAQTWSLVRRSGLRMAYIGAESPNDGLLREIRKGTRADQTLAVAELCRRQGVIPELSFMVAPPVDTEGETERTFEFIREVKRVNPHAEIIVYIYTPLPSSAAAPNRACGLRHGVAGSHRGADPISQRPRRSGRSSDGSTTPAMLTPRGWMIGYDDASATSSRCCAADSRPYRTCAVRRGPKGSCAPQRRGATDFSATTGPGN